MNTFLSNAVARISTYFWLIVLIGTTIGLQAQDYGRSLDFDGINDHVTLSGLNDFGKLEHWSGAYAIEFWMKDDGSQVGARAIDIGSAFARLYIVPNNSSGNLEVGVNGASTSTTLPLQAGWNHIAISVDPSANATLYINGIQESTGSLPGLTSFGGLTVNLIGKSFDNDPFFKGRLDEVRFWGKELASSDITDRMSCELSGEEDDLIAYFKMNGGYANGFNGGFFGDKNAENYGRLSSDAGTLTGFTLSGTQSNWSDDSGVDINPDFENAMEFDGFANYFQINEGDQIVLSDGFTVQMWVFPMKNEGLLLQRTGSTDIVIGLNNTNDLICGIDVVDNSQPFVFHTISGGLEKYKWQHLTFRAKQTQGGLPKIISEVLIDGTLQSTITTNFQQINSNNFPIIIGQGFKGRISNLQIWSKSLSDEEIELTKSKTLAPSTENLTVQYNTYTDFSQGLVDNINGINAVPFYNPLFASDPCFVKYGDAPSDMIVENLGASINLEVDIDNCNDINFEYQWMLNGEEVAGATNKVYSIPSVDLSNVGRYSLRVTACGNTFVSEDFRVELQNEGKVLKFDGVNDYVIIPTNTNSSQYTIETWVRFNSDPSNQSILFLSNDNGPEQYYNRQIRVNADGYLEHSAYNGQMLTATISDTMLIQDQWYHIRAQVNASDLGVTLNDNYSSTVDFFSAIGDPPEGGSKWFIGHPVCGHDAFDGEMADLRIWTNATNTSADYEILSDPGNLEHYFKFNHGFAGANNSVPIAIDTLAPTFTASTGQLHNFDLVGDQSNWMGCDQASQTNTFSAVPQSGIYDYQDSLILTCEVAGSPASVSYQWFKDNIEIEGATEATYVIASLQPKDDGEYYVRVSDEVLCDVYSPSASIAVEGPGQVLAFDGVDDYLETSTENYPEYTIELWVKFDDEVSTQNIISGDDGVNSLLTHQLYTNSDGYFSHRTFTNTSYNQVSTVQAEPNRWYHVAIRASAEGGEDISMIINGQLASSSINTTGAAYFGLKRYLVGKSVGDLNPFKGQIDALHIHDSWLSISDFDTERFLEKKFESGIVHSFLFNSGFPDSDNSNIISDGILDYGIPYINQVEKGNCTMYNFAKSGPTSNWKGCSPAQKPFMTIDNSIVPGSSNVVIVGGQNASLFANLTTEASIAGGVNLSDINYQWKKNGETIIGANSDVLVLNPVAISDTGSYQVIVTDNCPIQHSDTSDVLELIEGECYTEYESVTIDLSQQSSYSGSTEGPFEVQQNFDIVSGYCGTDEEYPGGSVVYYWNVTTPQTFDVKLTMESTVDLDMWIFNDDCDISNCIASSTSGGTATDSTNVYLDVGGYYILIDTRFYDGTDPNPTFFTLDISEVDNCAGSAPLACGDVITDNTATGTNALLGYCNDFSYPGSEKIYELVLTEKITLDAELSGMSENLDLFILDNTCRLDQCVASSTNGIGEDETIRTILDAGTYYFVVDGKDGVTGEFVLQVDCQNDFTASFDDNDAYVDLDWSLDGSLYTPQDTGVLIRLVTVPNTILYEEEYNTAAQVPAIMEGTFRDYIGPDLTKPYRLKVINRLSGISIYNELRTGKTLPFQEPEILSISQGDAPHKIDIQWRNHSKLSDNYRVLKDGMQIAALIDGYTEDSLIVNYTDTHDINDPSSIQDDDSAVYSIRAFSTNFFESYTDVDTTGSTSDINFNASDLTFANKIELTWADLSTHCNRIKIERNGIIMDIISSTNTMYVDMTPIYGEPVMYSLTMMQDAVEIMEVEDIGSVAPNGKIEGSVTSEGTALPVRDVTVTLLKDTIIDGDQVFNAISTTTTDFLGRYLFEDISYGLAHDFQVAVSKTGYTFVTPAKEVTLNGAIPTIQGVNFVQIEGVIIDSVMTFIDTLYADSSDVLGLIDITWDYAYPLSNHVAFFLYRDGNLIFESDDSNGKISTYRDLTGVPNKEYNYILQAFSEDGTNTMFQTKSTVETYPLVPVISGFEYVLGEFEYEGIPGESDHNSTIGFQFQDIYSSNQTNVEGLRIFRNGQLIGDIQEGTQLFEFLAPPNIEAGYSVRAYRKIDEASYESQAFPSEDTLITALSLFPVFVGIDEGGFGGIQNKNENNSNNRSASMTDELLSQRAIPVSYKHPDPFFFGQLSEVFAGFTFDGVQIERKLTSEPDSAYQVVDNLDKSFMIAQIIGGETPTMYDTYTIPWTEYDYRVSSYIDLDGNLYQKDTTFTRLMEEIEGPNNLSKVEDFGKVTLNWEENSEFIEFSYLFINYDGIMVTRRDILSSSTDTLAYLPQKSESYSDYISNPQFNQFLNEFVPIEYEYTVSSFITIDGKKYFSPPLTIQAMPLNDITIEPTPTNFTASDDLPNHVKLCWEWEAAKQSEFVIFRGDTPIDTLPWTVRAYYDSDAPSQSSIEYQIASYAEGVLSAKVKALGGIKNEDSYINISGRVYDQSSAVGVPDVLIRYRNLGGGGFPQGFIAGTTRTDSLGRYTFNDVPKLLGRTIFMNASSNEAVFPNPPNQPAAFDSGTFSVGSSSDYSFDFESTLLINIDEENEEEEGSNTEVAQSLISGVTATPNSAQRHVAIYWSPSTGNYDGFEIWRANLLLATVMAGEEFLVIDSTGFPGEQYGYGVRVFNGPAGNRTYSPFKTTVARYPAIVPPINLTATPIITENLMRIAWSHPLNDHDAYRVTRDGQFKALIPTTEPQMWYDSTGIPGREYQYQVVAVDGNFISDPASIVERYKGVGEVVDLSTIVVDVPTCSGNQSHNNSVRVVWEYTQGAADGFEVYRDGDLIGQIDQDTLTLGNSPLLLGDTTVFGRIGYYDDYSGTPGENHTYHVLAFLIRDGVKVQSGVEELFLTSTIEYPAIADVKNLQVEGIDDLGATVISFDYEKEVVNGFEILRDGDVLDTILDSNAGAYTYQDISGIPGVEYSYSVRVYDVRQGQTYVSTPECVVSVAYPDVPAPQNFTASQGIYPSHIVAKWSFLSDAFVDSFELQNITLGTTFTYFGGKRFHQDIVNENVVDKFDYRVRALRLVDGQTKYSAWTDVAEGWTSNQLTGDEEAQLNGDCHSTLNGYSVDIDGDWAVSGAPSGDEAIHIYKRENGGWSLFQIVETDLSFVGYGYSVAISGDKIAIGAPNDLFSNYVFIYQFNVDQWELVQTISGGLGRFGHSLDMDGDNLVVGAPLNSLQGRTFFYHLENGQFVEKNSFGSVGGTAFYGAATAIRGNKAFVMWGRNNLRYVLEYSIDPNGNVTFTNEDTNNSITANGQIWNDNLDFDGEWLVLGDALNGKAKVINTATGIGEEILPPTVEGGQAFGTSVAIRKIPSPIDDAYYILVGSPGKALNGETSAGSAHLYSNVSGNWTVEQTLNFGDPKQDDQLGFSVAMSADAMIYGTPFRTEVNTGAVTVNNLVDTPSKVIASDGISADGNPGETSIYWEYNGIEDLLSGFNIYRDGELVTFRSISTTNPVNSTTIGGSWDDNTGNPGQRYVYSVSSVSNNIPFESYGTADEGFSRPDGIIQGNVITALGSVPIPGATIRAVGFVNDERYEYSTVSIADGSYIIPNVYYDNDESTVTTYTMTGEFQDHLMLPEGNADVVMNSELDPVIAPKNIIDYSAYVIKGQIEQPLVSCGLEGVQVYQVINGVQQMDGVAQTDAEGNYSLVINPNDPDLNTLAVRVEQYRIVDEDTIYHSFAPVQDTLFTDFVSFPLITDLDFTDTLKYTVPIKVKNTCNDRISTSKWEIQIRTADGCFEETYITDSNGDLEVDLLPLNYTMKVVDVDVISTANLKALSYFASFPVSLDLYNTHRDSIRTLTIADIEADATRQFTYHTAPNIVISGFNEFFCSTPAAVCEQGDTYTMSFDVTEMHGTDECSVSEGRIRITNPAAAGDLISFIEYDDVLGKFDDYTFVAGSPSTISPHIYGVAVDYFSDDGNYLGGDGIGIFVEGFVEIEGAAVMVDPASGNEQVPLPVMVLRDPPGDGSSSYISGGQTIAWTSSFETGSDENTVVNFEKGFSAFGQDFNLENEFTEGESSSGGNEISSEVTVTQTITTSSDPSLIGRMADIVVGQGLVMSYSVVDEYRVGTCDTITKSSTYSISPTPASTDWFYTVGQIEDIITGYRNDSIRIENSTLKLQLGDRLLSKQESLERNNTFINNWNAILGYHSLNTLPHYKICSEVPPIFGDVLGVRLGQITNWQNHLCPQLGTGSGSNFTLNEEIIWTDQLMDSYNAASISIRNLADDPASIGAFSFPSNGNISSILNNPIVVAEINSYGAPMKNITTSGGVSIEQSITNVNASTSGVTSSFYFDKELNVNFGVNIEAEVFKGGLVGAAGLGFAGGVIGGVINSVGGAGFQLNTTTTWQSNRASSRSNTISNEVTTGYTLFDDDFEDVFSVNVIQPIDQSQTAFFEFIGGQTSCPPEEGAVAIDRPQIAIIDIDAGGTSDSKELFNIPLDEAGIFDIIAINATLINSNPARELEIFLESGSNPNGASLILNGVDLSQSNYVATMGANAPDTLELRVLPGLVAYQYPDIVLGIRPTCSDNPVEYITVSTNFVNPCSPVSLVGPDSDWVINNDTTPLLIVMQDYDPNNAILNNATVQYRRIGQGNDWSDILTPQLEFGNYVTPQDLIVNDAMNLPQETDQYIFNWFVPTDGSFPDGEYEVRVIMDCSQFQETVSNVIRGRIARDGVKLLGVPEPADGLWTDGDEISATFDKDLDCALIQGANFKDENISITNLTTGETLGFDIICYANKILFELDDEMPTFDGQFLRVDIEDIPSTTGNISDQLSWEFRVITRTLYWNEGDTVDLVMYSGQTQQIEYRVENTNDVQEESGIMLTPDDGTMDSWIQIVNPLGSFTVPANGTDVLFDVIANTPVGEYIETINIVDGSSNPSQLVIRLKVLNEPPNWEVDPSDFTSNMELIANWKFNEVDLPISSDITDIVSVWVDGEIRGVANIEQAGEFYAAYITVYGKVEDGTDTPLEFHIWDADEGNEYDGHPATGTQVLYTPFTTRGTIVDPEILFVDKVSDQAKYIYLNQGWTGISFNTETENMSTEFKLKSLSHETEGDLLVSQKEFVKFTDSLGWFGFGEADLMTLNTNEGYMIYLENGPDTLRMTGANAEIPDITLTSGWNWIGFPFVNTEEIDSSFVVNGDNSDGGPTGNDKINRNYPLDGGGNPSSANWTFGNDGWIGSLEDMEANNLYKYYADNPNGANLSWTATEAFSADENQFSAKLASADPLDASTWGLPDYGSEEVMPIIAEVIIAGDIQVSDSDKLAFFYNDSIRAYGQIVYVEEYDAYVISLIGKQIPTDSIYDIKYYDASEGSILTASNELAFDRKGVGEMKNPYEIIFDMDPCPNTLLLGPTGSPFALDKTFEASQEIRVLGNLNLPAGVNIILSAPKVTIVDELNAGAGATITVRPDGCN